MRHKRIFISIVAVLLSSTAIHASHNTPPRYPEAVNEIITITSSDGTENDLFGYRVATDGDTLAISALLGRDYGSGDAVDSRAKGSRSGSVYIFERNSNSNDTWIEVKKLAASDRGAEDYFGSIIAIDGDTLLVRALDEKMRTGSTYVFERDVGGPNNWGMVTRLFDTIVMAISKDTIVTGSTGATGDDENGLNSGSVSIYERNFGGSNNWGLFTKLFASDGAIDDKFGNSVAIENNTIVVGASGDDDNGLNSGSAYIYERDVNSANGWREIKKMIRIGSGKYDNFGFHVAISGDTIAISELRYHGSVYIFERNVNDIPNIWQQVGKLRPRISFEDGLGGAGSIAIDGNLLVAGAPYDRDKGSSSGAAYFFKRNQRYPNQWNLEGKLNARYGQENDNFGITVAISGDQVIIGRPSADYKGARSGAVYIFNVSPDSLNREPPRDTGGLVIAGSANIVGVNITHPNGNVYNQVLLTGQRATVSSDGTGITRISFLDINDDIVQVEFSGNVTVTVTLDADTFAAAAPPIKYNQPSVNYVKGHPTIRVEKADTNTFLSIFTVGTINAMDQTLFPEGEVYDAMADVALLENVNSTGFGGIHCANTRFSGYTGKVGIYSPKGIAVRVLIGDIDARRNATPYLYFHATSFWVAAPNSGLRITGGDLRQTNGAPIVVPSNRGFDTLISQNSVKSDGTEQPAQRIKATFSNEDGRKIFIPVEEAIIE